MLALFIIPAAIWAALSMFLQQLFALFGLQQEASL